MEINFQNRPSGSELTRIINKAKIHAKSGNIAIPKNSLKLDDVREISIKLDLRNMVIEILDTLNPKDYVGHYTPKRSNDPKIGNIIVIFKYKCRSEESEYYIEFSVTEKFFWLISLRKVEKFRKICKQILK